MRATMVRKPSNVKKVVTKNERLFVIPLNPGKFYIVGVLFTIEGL
jgi:hypothetical protein